MKDSKPEARKPHVIIAGAGMGGLTLAAALLQKGFDVDVYEQSTELREVGAGLWISANGSKILEKLGLKSAIEAINLPPEDRVVRFWKTGESHSVYNRDAKGSKADHTLVQVLRAELQRVLYEAVVRLKPDAIHFGMRSLGADTHDGRARLQLEGGHTVEGDVVVGCDGAHSRVRQSLFGPAGAAFRPRASSNSNNCFDLHGNTVGKRVRPSCRARVRTLLTKHFQKEIGATVDHLEMVNVVRGRVHQAEDLDHALHPIQIALQGFTHRR